MCTCECLLILQEIKSAGATCNIMWNVSNFFTHFLCSYMFQVQNLNNIMAFPLENVLKSELRDSRLVSLDLITTSLHMMMTTFQCFVLRQKDYTCLKGKSTLNVDSQAVIVPVTQLLPNYLSQL